MKVVIRTENAPVPFQGAPYSQAIRFADLVFDSGQLPVDPATGKIVEGGIAEQTERVMENLKAILEAAGTSLGNAVKASIFLVDLADFQGINEVYGGYVGDRPPARATFQVAALPAGARLGVEDEIESRSLDEPCEQAVEHGQTGIDVGDSAAVDAQPDARRGGLGHALTRSICAPTARSRSSIRSYPRSISATFPGRPSMCRPARS